MKLPLPSSDVQVTQASAGRTQKAAVTKNGRLLVWEVSSHRSRPVQDQTLPMSNDYRMYVKDKHYLFMDKDNQLYYALLLYTKILVLHSTPIIVWWFYWPTNHQMIYSPVIV